MIIVCHNCGGINDDENTYCEQCRELLYVVCPDCAAKVYENSSICPICLKNLNEASQRTVCVPAPFEETLAEHRKSPDPTSTATCEKCGAVNESENIYCERCRSRLDNASAQPYQPGLAVYTVSKFRIPAFVLALVGASIGATFFLVALVITIGHIRSEVALKELVAQFINYPLSYSLGDILMDFGAKIIAVMFSLVAFIMGFTGSSRIIHYERSGNFVLIAAGVLNLLSVLSDFWLFAVPGLIMLLAGIMASFRIKDQDDISTKR